MRVNVMKIYDALPICMQNIIVSMEGLRIRLTRYNKEYRKQYDAFMERNEWSYQKKCKYRDEQLRKMVKHCYETVPYYNRIFNEKGIDYRTIRTIEDLSVVPMLTKDVVKENFEELFSTKYKRNTLIKLHTSGTTGAGLVFYQDKVANAAVWAHVWRGNYNIGLERNTWCGYFGGRSIVPKKQKKGPHYRINYFGKQIMFSAFHMRDEVFQEYFDVLEKYKPLWIQAYPSSIVPLAQYMLDNDLRLSYRVKVLTLSSENVTEKDNNLLYKIFGIYPMQNYAQSEAVATFRQRLDKKIFVDEDFSAVEFIPMGEGDLYKVVGTTLSNYAMPFLRYDTKDIVTYKETGLGREILSIDGREEDSLKIKNGGIIRRLSVIFKDQVNIRESQIIQRNLDEVEFHIVKGKFFSEVDEEKLVSDIEEYLAEKIKYRIVYKEKIEKNKNGKVKFIISEI